MAIDEAGAPEPKVERLITVDVAGNQNPYHTGMKLVMTPFTYFCVR